MHTGLGMDEIQRQAGKPIAIKPQQWFQEISTCWTVQTAENPHYERILKLQGTFQVDDVIAMTGYSRKRVIDILNKMVERKLLDKKNGTKARPCGGGIKTIIYWVK